ncbi:hypothetical protein WAI453_013568 [Rhynchosporium graminicola]
MITKQHFMYSSPEAHSIREDTRTRPIEAPQLTTGIPLPIIDANNSIPNTAQSTPKLTIQKASETIIEGAGEQPEPEAETLKQLEARIKDLRKIIGLDEIPKNDEYLFKERLTMLLEKWEASLEQEGQTTSSTGQLIKHDSTGLDTMADELEAVKIPDANKLLGCEVSTLATGLMEH